MIRTDVVPDVGTQTTEALIAEAAAFRTAMANSKIRLFKSTVASVNASTLKAALVAAECDFDGYPEAGLVLAAWNEPLRATNGTVVIYGPVAQFNFLAGDPIVQGSVGGYWVEDSTGAVRQVVKFQSPVEMLSNADSLPIVPGRRFGKPE